MTLKAPFPYFGGKSLAASIVWDRFGDVPNYVEPFAGSLAVLLLRPHEPKTETVNDLDGMIANFWRAVAAAPEAVAHYADWPVNEDDLHARHYWLVTAGRARLASCLGDPLGYDAQVAGWWLWGTCAWIGGGWCSGNGPWWVKEGTLVDSRVTQRDGTGGVFRRLPSVGDSGRGINRQASVGQTQRQFILNWMLSLWDRLRRVRVCHGDWSRVTGPSVMHGLGMTGVFLDPPYANGTREKGCYTEDCGNVAADARKWAIENGGNPKMRIALCGYEGEHEMPEAWECVPWKANGGYGNHGAGRGRDNAGLERVWFSPHCLKPGIGQGELL